MINIVQHHSGSGDNIGGDYYTNTGKFSTLAKEIKSLLTTLNRMYRNDIVTVGVKAIGIISDNITLKKEFVDAIKRGGSKELKFLIDDPAFDIVLAAGKLF